jgi:hypothetical protein
MRDKDAMLLKKLVAAMRSSAPRHEAPAAEYPLEAEEKVTRLHARAAVGRHLDILHGDERVGAESYLDLHARCLERTSTAFTPYTVFQRFQTRRDLLRYFMATLDVAGARGECGTYRGATALLLCHAWRTARPGFDGAGFYLVDSFSGTGQSTAHDLIPVREPGGATRMQPFFTAGKTDVTADLVRGYFADFPKATICAGWVPAVFGQLPDSAWAFVHIDLTLYEATLAALRYFHPRLAAGGVVVVSGTVFCPGVQHAVDEFSTTYDAPYVVLGYGERVFLKD